MLGAKDFLGYVAVFGAGAAAAYLLRVCASGGGDPNGKPDDIDYRVDELAAAAESTHFRKNQRRVQRLNSSVVNEPSHEELLEELNDCINPSLSPSDNAAALLHLTMSDARMSRTAQAVHVYAIKALKSDYCRTTLPAALMDFPSHSNSVEHRQLRATEDETHTKSAPGRSVLKMKRHAMGIIAAQRMAKSSKTVREGDERDASDARSIVYTWLRNEYSTVGSVDAEHRRRSGMSVSSIEGTTNNDFDQQETCETVRSMAFERRPHSPPVVWSGRYMNGRNEWVPLKFAPFKRQGSKLTGSGQNEVGEYSVTGTINGEHVEFVQEYHGKHSLTYAGKLSKTGKLEGVCTQPAKLGGGQGAFELQVGRGLESSPVSGITYYDPQKPEEISAINKALEGVDLWEWEIFPLVEASQGHTLQVLGLHILQKWDLIQKLNIDEQKLCMWLAYIESNYVDTPYHNQVHAADVTQSVHAVLASGGFRAFLSDLQVLALLLTAMMHDVGHDGFNNTYHKHAQTERALTFNDQSIQENHHLRVLFESMRAHETIDIFRHFASATHHQIREMMIHMVLHTDMQLHFVSLKEYKVLAEANGTSVDLWKPNALNLMSFVLHSCDISSQTKAQKMAVEWGGRCLEEFFKQGDVEKSKGLPVSPACDRDCTPTAQSQTGFIKFIVLPQFEALALTLPWAHKHVEQLRANIEFWQLFLKSPQIWDRLAGISWEEFQELRAKVKAGTAELTFTDR